MARVQHRRPTTRKTRKAKRSAPPVTPEIKPVETESTPAPRQEVEIPSVLTVKDFAGYLNVPVTQVIATLMKNGVIANINENIDAETAMIIGDELNFDVKEKIEPSPPTPVAAEEKEETGQRVSRPPVVTIMGHVDHGKTTLLDSIRRTNVVATESGGITQHIGAYQVEVRPSGEPKSRDGEADRGISRLITFLDTPGHEAFSAMRAHGAAITDIVVLVVAADDGVKPQTVEAINHARAAGVPVVVAINKIDVPGANPERVKQELAERELIPEEWGGKTVMVPVSAKKNEHINELLEMILLVADVKELTTNPNKPATGVVIESHMQAGVGPVATVLINDGALHQGDSVVIGHTYGRIRFMEDFRGRRIKTAIASTPIRVAGLQDVPNFGEPLITVESEKVAREMTQVKSAVRAHIGMAEVSEAVSKNKLKELKIILKTDVQGSLEAIHSSIGQLGSQEVSVQIINEGVGNISESDVNMAAATNALVIGFRISITPPVRQLVERLKVKVSLYEIIYQLLDDLYAALSGLLEPEKVEVKLGTAEILKIFHSTKTEQIIGARVTSGKLVVGAKVKVIRLEEDLGEATIKTLKREQENVDTILGGIECGIGLAGEIKINEGDILQAYQIEERVRKLG